MFKFLDLNFFAFLFQVTCIAYLNCVFLKKGIEWVASWLTLLAILMNLFILKQIRLVSLDLTTCDAYAIGFLSCLNMIREFYGIEKARTIMRLSLVIPVCFLIFSAVHLLFVPSSFDRSQSHYLAVLIPSFRTVCASIFVFRIVQFFDIKVFSFLNTKWKGKFFNLRSILSLFPSQIIDTLLFSFLGLYGIVADIKSVILMGLATKGLAALAAVGLSSLLLHIQPVKKVSL